MPWSNGKFLDWDATHVSHKPSTAREAEGAAVHSETAKAKKYKHLDCACMFQPVAFETCDTARPDTIRFLCILGNALDLQWGEPSSFAYLLQWLSVVIQVGNMVSMLGSLPTTDFN